MKQEDKQLILKDLSARLPYGVICHYNCAIRCDTMEINKANCVGKLEGIIPINGHIGFMVGGDKVNTLFHDIKPYLRPMSSITKEESAELSNIISKWFDKEVFYLTEEPFLEYALSRINYSISPLLFDYLNSIHVDYRGLIPMGLAIEVTKENNPYEN